MLSGFSKLFDKAFAIGFLLPVVLALAVLAWLFPGWALTKPLADLAAADDQVGKLVYLGLTLYAATTVLTLLNVPFYKLIEGYGPLWAAFPGLLRWQARRRKKLLLRQARLNRRWAARRAAGGDLTAAEHKELKTLWLRLNTRFPPEENPVLPTGFGNVLRAFEAYPLRVYGADGVPIWPRLCSVIGKDFAATLQDAQSQVNCLVNLMVLAAAAGLAAIVAALWTTPWGLLVAAAGHGPGRFIGTALGLGLSPRFVAGLLLWACIAVLYRWAIDRALEWGEQVRAAFDCYLPDLYKQLGYAMPEDEGDRKRFWADVNALVLYHQPMTPGAWKTPGAPAPAQPSPPAPRFADRHRL